MRKKRIVVVGSSNTDMIIKTERIPVPGETIMGGDFFTASGGKGANQAVAAARLGAPVTFIGRIGTDDSGNRAVENLRRERVDTRHTIRDRKAPSGIASIIVDRQGENSIVVAPGSNNRLLPSDIRKARKVIEQAAVLLLQLEIPLSAVKCAVDIAAQAGTTIILNPAPAVPLSKELLKKIDILTPNKTEAALLSGVPVHDIRSAQKAAEVLHNKGVKTILLTLGNTGTLVVSGNLVKKIPTIKIRAVDTTAAGDAFNGTLAYARTLGYPIEKAVRLANIAGALTATKVGAQPSLPNLSQLRKFQRF